MWSSELFSVVKLNSVPLTRRCYHFSFRPVSEADAHGAIFRISSNAVGPDKTPIKHSTTSTLLKMTDNIRAAMDKKLDTILMLFDFSKAFDCIVHSLLDFKLSQYGFLSQFIDWIKSSIRLPTMCLDLVTESHIGGQ